MGQILSINMKGDLKRTTRFLEKAKRVFKVSDFDAYAQQGLEALSSATPVDSGKTASSWEYKIEINQNGIRIAYYNTNVVKGVPIAIILQYGHGTRNGGWVEGRDYINPAIQPIFDKIVESVWREVVNA